MSANDTTQRQVIERLNLILHPARATMAAAQNPPRAEQRASDSVRSRLPRRTVRAGAMQQRYRLYRVCGYGVVSAWFYAAKAPSW
jgi:hypothetical protein